MLGLGSSCAAGLSSIAGGCAGAAGVDAGGNASEELAAANIMRINAVKSSARPGLAPGCTAVDA